MADRNHPFWNAVDGSAAAPPAAALLGWKVLEAEPEGGFVAAMLDGPALATTFEKGEFGPTLELRVNFLRPGRPGKITGEGRVVRRGGSIAFLSGELRDQSGDIIATARIVQNARPEDRPSR